ncbi:hypothetical protein J6590_016324 [Homalodisca vitripennis]|nr:hypothetical protein J6590_016324 [Homalodisca vitripennis]
MAHARHGNVGDLAAQLNNRVTITRVTVRKECLVEEPPSRLCPRCDEAIHANGLCLTCGTDIPSPPPIHVTTSDLNNSVPHLIIQCR